jgi:hypothetical protein
VNHIKVCTQFLALSSFAWPTGAFAQQVSLAPGNPQVSGVPAAAAQVPRLVKFSGAVKDAGGKPVSGMAGIAFALYQDQQGGTPLWIENQNVQPDATGHYTVWLGATKNDGVPVELFASGQARWLGVQVEGQPEQARVLLAAVPYALKAGDADTLGGRPASAYLLASPPTLVPAQGSSVTAQPAQSPNSASAMTAAAVAPDATTTNYIAKFINTTGGVGNSVMYQKGSNIGVGTKTPAATLEVNGKAQVDGGSILASGGVPVIQFPTASNNFSAGLSALANPGNTGTADTAVGHSALGANTTGYQNTAVGDGALYYNTAGNSNTAVGVSALLQNTTGSDNTASGYQALFSNTASSNTADGYQSLFANTTGNNNTVIGYQAMYANTTGIYNTASGSGALPDNTTGTYNTAGGGLAMFHNTTGSNNTVIGCQALYSNITGGANVAIGYAAGINITTSNNIDISNYGASSDSGVIRIGSMATQTSAFIAGIQGVTTGNNNAVPVLIDSNGQLGTVSSSRRYKEDIRDMGDTSSGLMRLRPVTFRYKKPFDDGFKPVQYGLIAEEVAEVYPDLVARSADGQIETVKYQLLDSMLLNELQKQNTTIAAQKEQIHSLEERLAKVEAALQRTSLTASSR